MVTFVFFKYNYTFFYNHSVYFLVLYKKVSRYLGGKTTSSNDIVTLILWSLPYTHNLTKLTLKYLLNQAFSDTSTLMLSSRELKTAYDGV